MAKNKIERVDQEITKVREKIAEYQEKLKALEAQGVEILPCGTCLNFYGLTEKLAVGSVTDMYTIAEKLTQAGNVVKP